MKESFLIILIHLLILSTNWAVIRTIDLNKNGRQDIKLNYLYNHEMQLTHYEFVAHIGHELELNKTTTAICFKRQNNATDIKVGDKGFGIEFSCFVNGGCSDGSKLNVSLFASHLSSLLPPTWHAGVHDYSSSNTGILYAGNATNFDTTYSLGIFEAEDLTFPALLEPVEWRCYFNFNGNFAHTRLDL